MKEGVVIMGNTKKTYYISVGDGLITELSTVSPWNFKIEATDEEIIQLRHYFDQVYSSDWKGFYRAQLPFIEYHYDSENDEVDNANKRIYEMLYELGDEQTREHIRTQGLMAKIDEQE